MSFGRYNFHTLFEYNAGTGVIVPKYRTVINGTLIEKGSIIYPYTYTGGVDLFSSIDKAFVGSWDRTTRTMTISGVYQ